MFALRVLLTAALVTSCSRRAEDIACGSKGETYLACGCGCCPGGGGEEVVCIDTSRGDTLAKVRARDEAARKSDKCRMMGCSKGTLFKCCD